MKKTKLYKVFMALSIVDVNQFQQFLNAAFFNQREDVKKLLEWMLRCRKTGKWTDLPTTFKYVYPKQNYQEKQMRLAISRLFKLLEHFLAIREIRTNEPLLQQNLLKSYRKLKLDKYFEQTWRASQKKWQGQSLRHTAYWLYQYEMEFAYYDYIGSQTREAAIMEKMGESFDIYMMGEKLKIGCLQIAHQAVRSKKYATELLEEVVQHIEKYPEYLHYPAIGIYYFWYKAITEKANENHFIQLRRMVSQHQHEFPAIEIRDIYLLVINYCIKRLNSEEDYYIKEAFELYRSGLEQGILVDNGLITNSSFTNVIALGLRLNRADWVDDFIQKFQNKLHPKFKENLVLFNQARLEHFRGNYKAAMQLLVRHHSPDHYTNLLAQTLLLKMYYELEEIEPLLSHLDNMKSYLSRKKILSDLHKANFLNIVKLANELTKLPPYDREKKEKLRQQILTMQPLGEREWFLKQLGY